MKRFKTEYSENDMKRNLSLVSFMFFALLTVDTLAQPPALPDNALTKWVVDEPEEIASYLIFDPATVKDRLPSSLRFITIGELAAIGIPWANDHLNENPTNADWGISFIEIVRMKTFEIDGRSPEWPEHGAAALWFARVAPSEPKNELGPGRPFLALEFWMPDSLFVTYMREKGHYASYGDVHLYKNSDGKWLGTIEVDGLSVIAECIPTGDVEGFGSGGMQGFFPPAQSGVTSIVRVAFAGHRIQECKEDAFWIFKGVHPLVKGVILGASTFQFGYDLIGGAYHK